MDIPIAPSPTQNAQIRAWWKRVTKVNNGLSSDNDMKAADGELIFQDNIPIY